MVPILIFSYEHLGFSPSVLTHVAIGTSLFVVVFACFMGAYQHRKHESIHWHSVFVIGLSSALTAFMATWLAAALSGEHLQMVFAIIVMAASIRMLTESEIQARKKLEFSSKPSLFRLTGVGITIGVVSALAGVGGGVIAVPMMYFFINMPLKLVIGTSSAIVFFTALFSVLGYIMNGIGRTGLPEWSLGFVDLQRGAALAIGTILLARVGAYVSFKSHPHRLRKLFALFIMLISIYMLVK